MEPGTDEGLKARPPLTVTRTGLIKIQTNTNDRPWITVTPVIFTFFRGAFHISSANKLLFTALDPFCNRKC